jgi:hypothetical protein
MNGRIVQAIGRVFAASSAPACRMTRHFIRNGDTTTNFSRRTVINKTGAAGAGINGCHLEQLDERGITEVAAF